jgi:MerR family copper efflux transcriptional regulator
MTSRLPGTVRGHNRVTVLEPVPISSMTRLACPLSSAPVRRVDTGPLALDLRLDSNPYGCGVRTYTIGEVAERSGFTASSLRYYEGIGLVTPAARSLSGYRLYDERAFARLGFIARAKQLGCSLEEITDLVAIWDGDRCDPVQRRFHELVTTKISDAERQIDELSALTGQLHAAATQLARPASDGPCGEGCACLAAGEAAAQPVAATARVGVEVDATPAEAPIVCTLADGAVADRLEEWRTMLRDARSRAAFDGGLRIEFGAGIEVTDLAWLVAAEQRCCAFFDFAITVDARGIGLEVRAPDDAGDVVTTLFGEAA